MLDIELCASINAQVLRGIRQTNHSSVNFKSAKIHLSKTQYEFISTQYKLGFRLKKVEEFLNHFRIIRANYSTPRDYSKILDGSFKVATRKSRLVAYNSIENGKLKTNYIRPPPYMVIAFTRLDCKREIE